MGNCFFVAATDKGRGNAIAGGMEISIASAIAQPQGDRFTISLRSPQLQGFACGSL